MEVLTILSSFAGLLIEGGKCLSREIGYFIDYKENNDELKTQMEDLLAKRRDIKKFVEAALMRGEEIREAVGHWTRSVDKIEEEVIHFDHDFESVQNDGKCRIGCCPARYILGKKAIKKLTYVSSLIERAPSPYQVSIPPSIPRSVTSAMGDLMPLESRSLDRNSVMEALKNENIHMIGVYGMEGVGKTTLIRQVGKQAEEEGVFYLVVVVVVSQTPNLKNIQGAIAEMLGLKLNENDSIEIRANTLYTRLKQEKSVLIILDDLSERVDLSHIGIPHGNEHKGCKVLLTTRDQNVCRAMGREDSQSMKTIELGVLSEQEAWALFRWSTGEDVESLELIVVASEVAAQCRGLPLTIVTLGRALHGKQEIGVWEHAATELKNSKATNIKEMERSIAYSCIKFSYEQLPNEEIKQLLLLCCLFPKDHNISVEEVVEYGMGEGLFEDIDMLDEARGKAQRIIDNLKDCRLLLNGDERKVSYLRCGLDREIGHVRMHEVVRDMGISIASSSSLVVERQELNGWPPSNNKRESKDEHVRRMSLMHNQILELPSQLEYPQLQTLLMQFNYMLEEVMTIPDTFFEGMAALRVLDLTNNGYMPVPMSLYSLTNLRTLRLHCKKTSNLSGLRELRELQILVLTVTSDKEHMLPKELGQLTNLRLLDFQCNNNSITIAPQVISNFSMLEELCIKALDNKVGWEKETSREITSDASSSFAEITCLPNLTALDVSMPEANCLPQHVNTLPNWTRFHINIGFSFIFDDDIPIKLKMSRSLILCNTEISTLPNWFKRVVLSKAEALLFYNVSNQDVRKLFVESDFQLYLSKCDLKILVVRYCDGIKSLLNVMELDSESKEIALMDNLEELHLKKLENFRRICHGQLPNGSFKKLRILRINKCDKLRSLLSPSLARSLSQLEEIEIKDCKVLKEIIAKDAEMVQVEEKIVFPQLKIIKLCYLKNITSFYLGSAPIECPSLEQVKVYECQKMKVFASRLQNTPEPKLIEGGGGDLKWYERDVNNAMQFQHQFLRIWRLFCRLVKPLRNHLREKEEGIKNQLDKLKKDWLADAELVTLSSLRDKEALNAERWSTAESWVDEVEHHLIRIDLLRPEEIPNMQFLRTMELLYRLIRPLVHFVGLRYHKLQELIQELSKLKERWRQDPQLRKLVSSSSSVGEPTSSIRWKIAERWKGDFERHLGSSGLLPVVGCTTERIRKFFQVMKLFVKMDPLDNYLDWRLGWDPKLKQMVKNCSKELEHHWVMDPELMTLISSPKEGLREKKKNIAERWRDEFKHQVISLGLLPDGDTPEHIKELLRVLDLLRPVMKSFSNYLQDPHINPAVKERLKKQAAELLKQWEVDHELITLSLLPDDDLRKPMKRRSTAKLWQSEFKHHFKKLQQDLQSSGYLNIWETFDDFTEKVGHFIPPIISCMEVEIKEA